LASAFFASAFSSFFAVWAKAGACASMNALANSAATSLIMIRTLLGK